MKNWLKFAAVLVVSAVIFTACEDDDEEIFLNVPADETVDLGAEGFDPMEGVSVTGTDLENVTYEVTPQWDPYLVDQYLFTYSAEDVTAERTVYIQADNLSGNYVVSDVDDDGTEYDDYIVDVIPGSEYNELRLNEYLIEGVFINAIVNGPTITIPVQERSGWEIQGTGSYDGEEGVILTIDYIIDGEPGTSTFSK